jgi:hypothetical protein
MVVDVGDAPRMNKIIALWWGNGHGRISPFMTTYLELMNKYKPVFCGVDSTSNQKNFAEVMNMEYITDGAYSVEKIHGMDFSGMRRYQYLVACRISLEMGVWTWPKIATGIGSQLKAYDPVEDRVATSKLAQDLVSGLSMASFASRALYPPEPDQEAKANVSTKFGAGTGRVSEVRRVVQRSGARR